MKKSSIAITGKINIFVLLIFMALQLSGCATVGTIIPTEKQILFNAEETGEGTLKSGQLSLKYSYKPVGENMSFNGVITSVWEYDSITVRVLFIDGIGTVLEQKIVYFKTSGLKVDASVSHTFASFKNVSAMPPGTKGISFRMSGEQRQNWSD